MCGRYTLTAGPDTLARTFKAGLSDEYRKSWKPRYNIPPGSGITAIIEDRNRGGRWVEILHWGLVPAWATDPKIGYKLINARAETLSEKPSFRDAFRYRRCLLPASGFYEWDREVSPRQPYYFFPEKGELMALAGVWEHWLHASGSEILSVSIVTTEARGPVERIHDRMPVILRERDWARWLDPNNVKAAELKTLLVPAREDFLKVRRVAQRVNKTTWDEPALIEEAAGGARAPSQLDLFSEEDLL